MGLPQRVRACLWLLCCLPLLVLVLLAVTDRLGTDPGAYVVEYLGHTALCLLLATLALSSVVRLGWWQRGLRYRRLLGLFTFFYAALHLLAFVAFILAWQWREIGAEIVDRPYITMGMLALLGLLVLAVTSNRWAMRALGRNWKRLHRLVYVVLALVLVHVAWQLRADAGIWLAYMLVAALLAGERVTAAGCISHWKIPAIRSSTDTR